MYCSNCKTIVWDKVDICPHCGASMEADQEEAEIQLPEPLIEESLIEEPLIEEEAPVYEPPAEEPPVDKKPVVTRQDTFPGQPVPGKRPRFYTMGFVLGILSTIFVSLGVILTVTALLLFESREELAVEIFLLAIICFILWPILVIIGLILACISQRKAAVILNSVTLLLPILLFASVALWLARALHV